MPTFTNSTGLTIGDLSKSVQTLTVSGVTGRTESISITITGLTHDSSDDPAFLLVGPDGRNLVFWSDAGGNNRLANVTFSISDAGASPLSDAGHLSGGTFQPADYGEVETAFSFGAKGSLTLNH